MEKNDQYRNETEIGLYFYYGQERALARSLAFSNKNKKNFPSDVIEEMGFPRQMKVGQEIVIPAIKLKPGKSIKIIYHSNAFSVIGNCMISPNEFVFPKRESQTTWFLKFVALKKGEVIPYVTFQTLQRTILKTIGIYAGLIGAFGGALIPLIKTIENSHQIFSGEFGLSALGTGLVAILASSFWNKIETFTKSWETIKNDNQTQRKGANNPKLVGEGAIKISEDDSTKWPIKNEFESLIQSELKED